MFVWHVTKLVYFFIFLCPTKLNALLSGLILCRSIYLVSEQFA